MKKIGTIVQKLLDRLCFRADLNKSELLERFWNAFWNLLILEGNGVPYHYTESVLTSHLKGCVGSEFVTDSPDVLSHLLFADYCKDWVQFEPDPIAKKEGCSYFKLHIPNTIVGYLGAVDINTFPDNQVLSVKLNHANRFEVLADVDEKIPTNDVTLVLGKEGDKEIVFTMHPGLPMPSSDIYADKIPVQITVEEAKKYGFKTVKLVTKPKKGLFN